MPKTIKELVELKLNSLKGKVHLVQQYVNKLHENMDSLPMDGNYLLVLDNMLLSMDEFMTNFDGLNQSAQTAIKYLEKSALNKSDNDTQNADILSRVDKLEEVMNAMRTEIHGGDDGETSHPTGIMSHVSVLENSFNEGKQKLVSVEQRMQDMSVRHVRFVNEVRTKAMKEDRKKEEDFAMMQQFKNLDEQFQGTISDNNAIKQRLKSVEDQLKTVKSISDTNNKLTQMLKVKTKTITTKDEEKKELEKKSVIERFQKMEDRFQTTISFTDVCNQRLTSVEDQLKSVKSVDDANRNKEINTQNFQNSHNVEGSHFLSFHDPFNQNRTKAPPPAGQPQVRPTARPFTSFHDPFNQNRTKAPPPAGQPQVRPTARPFTSFHDPFNQNRTKAPPPAGQPQVQPTARPFTSYYAPFNQNRTMAPPTAGQPQVQPTARPFTTQSVSGGIQFLPPVLGGTAYANAARRGVAASQPGKVVGQTQQQSIHIPGQDPLTASMLAQSPPQEQKQMLGERLFPLIQNMQQELAAKITGMLLEIDNAELLHMLESQESLKLKVDEAVAVLQAHQDKEAGDTGKKD